MWVLAQLVANIADWVIDRRGRILSVNMQIGYQAKAFTHLLFVPLSFHKDEKIGELSNNISKTSWQIASISENILVSLVPPILSVIVGFTVTFLINPIFTLVLVSGVIVYVLVLIKLVVPTTNLLEEGHSRGQTHMPTRFKPLRISNRSNIWQLRNTRKKKSKRVFWAIQQHFGINSIGELVALMDMRLCSSGRL